MGKERLLNAIRGLTAALTGTSEHAKLGDEVESMSKGVGTISRQAAFHVFNKKPNTGPDLSKPHHVYQETKGGSLYKQPSSTHDTADEAKTKAKQMEEMNPGKKFRHVEQEPMSKALPTTSIHEPKGNRSSLHPDSSWGPASKKAVAATKTALESGSEQDHHRAHLLHTAAATEMLHSSPRNGNPSDRAEAHKAAAAEHAQHAGSLVKKSEPHESIQKANEALEAWAQPLGKAAADSQLTRVTDKATALSDKVGPEEKNYSAHMAAGKAHEVAAYYHKAAGNTQEHAGHVRQANNHYRAAGADPKVYTAK